MTKAVTDLASCMLLSPHPSDNRKQRTFNLSLFNGHICFLYYVIPVASVWSDVMCFWAFDGGLAPAYMRLNIAIVSVNLLLCSSRHLTQLSDRFVRVLAALACQLALMLNVHILFSCGSCMPGIRSGVERVDWHLLTAQVRDTKLRTVGKVRFIWRIYTHCVLGVLSWNIQSLGFESALRERKKMWLGKTK